MILYSYLPETDARTSCIHHYSLVLYENDSTRRAVLCFDGCLLYKVWMRLLENILWRPPFVWRISWLVWWETPSFTTSIILVTKVGLAAVYSVHLVVRPYVNQIAWHTTWYVNLRVEVGGFLWWNKNLLTETSGVSVRKRLGFDDFSLW